jgi:hypothetical protein
MMGPIRCPETSVNNYHTTPCNTPGKHTPHQHCDESLKRRLCWLISFHAVGPKRKSIDQTKNILMNWNTFAAIPLDFLGLSDESVSFTLQRGVQNAGAYVKI